MSGSPFVFRWVEIDFYQNDVSLLSQPRFSICRQRIWSIVESYLNLNGNEKQNSFFRLETLVGISICIYEMYFNGMLNRHLIETIWNPSEIGLQTVQVKMETTWSLFYALEFPFALYRRILAFLRQSPNRIRFNLFN